MKAAPSQWPPPPPGVPAVLAWTGQRYSWIRTGQEDSVLSATAPPGLPRFSQRTSSADHAVLANLAWSSSAHTGTAERLAGFSGAGSALEYLPGHSLEGIRIHGMRRMVRFHDHFLTLPVSTTTTNTIGTLLVTASGTSAAPSAQPTTEQGRPGIVRLATGSTATGRCAIHSTQNTIRLGGGEWRIGWGVRPAALSTSAQRYQFAVGAIDNPTAITMSDGVYWLYDEGAVATGSLGLATWQCVTSNAGTRTVTDSGVTVSTTTWAELEARVNADGTSVDFLHNGSVVQTHTTHIPTAVGELVCVGAAAFKSIGSTAANVDLDYVSVAADLV